VRNIERNYFALSELHVDDDLFPGATRLALLGACPWLTYFAPLALYHFSFSNSRFASIKIGMS